MTAAAPLRVGVVNDLRIAVEALRRLLASEPDLALAWTAKDGAEAVARCVADRPDLVLMDLVMPGVDGVEATRRIMREAPCPIVVVTATVDGNLSKVYDALAAGALDAVNGPTFAPDGTLKDAAPVVRKIRTIRRLGTGGAPLPSRSPPPETSGPWVGDDVPLVALGASTGGPDAVSRVLAGLPRALECPLVVVQHLDADFVPGLVEWLGRQSGRRVEIAEGGARPRPGCVHVAPGGIHLAVGSGGTFRLKEEPTETPYRPSVDVFLASAARAWKPGGVAVVLTGMGRDGAEGLLACRRAGWATFAQDEASSVVFGMPRAAAEAGGAAEVAALDDLGGRVHAAWASLRRAGDARRA
jgi:two-component system response regulator WspF